MARRGWGFRRSKRFLPRERPSFQWGSMLKACWNPPCRELGPLAHVAPKGDATAPNTATEAIAEAVNTFGGFDEFSITWLKPPRDGAGATARLHEIARTKGGTRLWN